MDDFIFIDAGIPSTITSYFTFSDILRKNKKETYKCNCCSKNLDFVDVVEDRWGAGYICRSCKKSEDS